MAVIGSRVNVPGTSTATLVASGGDWSDNAKPVLIKNMDSTNFVDLGGSSVTVGAGYRLIAGEVLGLSLKQGDDVYATSANAVTLSVLKGAS